jgi:tetratricopeptide (TPR) repeat protein
LYRSAPTARAELYVLALPWLSPAEARAIREVTWRGAKGTAIQPGSQRSDELAVAGARYQRDQWQVGAAKERWIMANLLRAWPDAGGTYLLGACAPAEKWDEARAALEEAAAGFEPVGRTGLEVAVERAFELEHAARTWRVVLVGPALEARVAGARQVAQEALRTAPGFEASGRALGAMAELAAMGRRGEEVGPGYDARAVEDLLARAEKVEPARARKGGDDSLRGHALLDLGEPARALALLEPIAAQLPRPRVELLFDIGEARLALGRRPEAEEAWRRAARTLEADRRWAIPGDGPLATDMRRRCDELQARIDARLGR